MANKVFVLIIFLLLLSGCASSIATYATHQPQIAAPGIYHEVCRGETLWSIAKAYNVNIEKIADINHIPNKTEIVEGQLIFIPGAKDTIKTICLTPEGNGFIWPVQGKIASYFGSMVDNIVNKGIDISVSRNQGVAASKDGKVVFIGRLLTGYGNTIIIEHSGDISTVYGSVDTITTKVGKRVAQGDSIGAVKQKDYLHFEVRKKANNVNPLYYLP